MLVVKAGRSDAGRRAGRSHTAAAASTDVTVDALFAQAGVLRIDTVEELLDAARVCSETQPVPAGGRIAVVGNEELLVRVGRLVEDVPEIAELDLNPVRVSEDGAVAVDVKVRVEQTTPRLSPLLRVLSYPGMSNRDQCRATSGRHEPASTSRLVGTAWRRIRVGGRDFRPCQSGVHTRDDLIY